MTREEALYKAKHLQKARLNICTDAEDFWNTIIAALEQEPCDDCISRQAVLEVIRKCHCEEWVKADIGALIEALSSVTSAEKVGHWEWVQYDGNPNIGNWHCSECNRIVCGAITAVNPVYSYKYCPECGTKMQEVDNEEA